MLHFNSKRVLCLAAGLTHTCAVDFGGKVYGWGSNRDAQVDPNLPRMRLSFPHMVSALQSFFVVKVAAGSYSSMALSGRGDCWVWGALTIYDTAPEVDASLAQRHSDVNEHSAALDEGSIESPHLSAMPFSPSTIAGTALFERSDAIRLARQRVSELLVADS